MQELMAQFLELLKQEIFGIRLQMQHGSVLILGFNMTLQLMSGIHHLKVEKLEHRTRVQNICS